MPLAQGPAGLAAVVAGALGRGLPVSEPGRATKLRWRAQEPDLPAWSGAGPPRQWSAQVTDLLFFSFLDAWIGELSGMDGSLFPRYFLGWWLLFAYVVILAIFLKSLSANLDGDRGLLLEYTSSSKE